MLTFLGEFSLLTLGIFFILFFFVACWTYGSCVPSGLFVPCILCGAAYGRFVATLLHKYVLNELHVYLFFYVQQMMLHRMFFHAIKKVKSWLNLSET